MKARSLFLQSDLCHLLEESQFQDETFGFLTFQHRAPKKSLVIRQMGYPILFNPIFLPSDNSILFSGRKEQFNTLYKYEISSQQVKDIVLLNTNNNTDIVDFVLSPDAKSLLIHSPLQGDLAQDIPTLFFLDGRFQEQLNSLAGFQVISWSAQ